MKFKAQLSPKEYENIVRLRNAALKDNGQLGSSVRVVKLSATKRKDDDYDVTMELQVN